MQPSDGNEEKSADRLAGEGVALEVERLLAKRLPSGFGFVLSVVSFKSGVSAYVSSGLREDMVTAYLRELADRLDEEETDGGT